MHQYYVYDVHTWQLLFVTFAHSVRDAEYRAALAGIRTKSGNSLDLIAFSEQL